MNKPRVYVTEVSSERIGYDLTTRHRNEDDVKAVFDSMHYDIKMEAIRRYKAIMVKKILFWVTVTAPDPRTKKRSMKEDMEKIKIIDSIGHETYYSMREELLAKWPSWISHERFTADDDLEVHARWIDHKGLEITIAYHIYHSDWNLNLTWLDKFNKWKGPDPIWPVLV